MCRRHNLVGIQKILTISLQISAMEKGTIQLAEDINGWRKLVDSYDDPQALVRWEQFRERGRECWEKLEILTMSITESQGNFGDISLRCNTIKEQLGILEVVVEQKLRECKV